MILSYPESTYRSSLRTHGSILNESPEMIIPKMISSMGFHTFSIFHRLTYDEALTLYKAFDSYSDINISPLDKKHKKHEGFPKRYIAKYRGKDKGITWYVRFSDELSNLIYTTSNPNNPNYWKEPKPYSVRAKINPKVFTGDVDYLRAANATYLRDVERLFNIEASKISPILGRFEDYFMNRIDYCFNANTLELHMGCTGKQLMYLVEMGDIPRSFQEDMWHDKEKSRKWKAYDNNFRLHNKSVTVNYYNKHEQLLDKFPGCPNIKESMNMVRFEIQWMYSKVYSISKPLRDEMKIKLTLEEFFEKFYSDTLDLAVNPARKMMSDEFAENATRKYMNKVIRKGDYFTLDGARWMVQSHNFRRDKEDRLLHTLDLVKESRGIAKAKVRLERTNLNGSGVQSDELKDFKRSLKDLDAIFVNPVTIPRRWGIRHIPHPLRAYYDCIYEERLITRRESVFLELLDDYLS